MSAPSWLRAFGFERPPFSKELGADELWVPTSRERIVDAIVDACHERGHVLLTGEPGVGKTCVLRAVRRRLPEAGFRLTYCHNATLGRRDFYRQLCLALGLSPKATAAAVFYAISGHVRELSTERVHPAFLLDEAHLLQQHVLDHLHILANYEWDSAALLSLVLVGLPPVGHLCSGNEVQVALRRRDVFVSGRVLDRDQRHFIGGDVSGQSVGQSAGLLQLAAQAGDIYGTADDFTFVHRQMTGQRSRRRRPRSGRPERA